MNLSADKIASMLCSSGVIPSNTAIKESVETLAILDYSGLFSGGRPLREALGYYAQMNFQWRSDKKSIIQSLVYLLEDCHNRALEEIQLSETNSAHKTKDPHTLLLRCEKTLDSLEELYNKESKIDYIHFLASVVKHLAEYELSTGEGRLSPEIKDFLGFNRRAFYVTEHSLGSARAIVEKYKTV